MILIGFKPTGQAPRRGVEEAATLTVMRTQREQFLMEIASIPTASGREDRVIEFIERWVAGRPTLRLSRDGAGNLWIQPSAPHSADSTVTTLFQAHLDHPAFVVDHVESSNEVWTSFRGGVLAPYFADARVALHGVNGRTAGRVVEVKEAAAPAAPFFRVKIQLDAPVCVTPGAIITWDLPEAVIEDGLLHAPACDDLAVVAAALCAIEALAGEACADVRVVLTRAEEVGFIGAIAACKEGAIPPGARILTLENSRSFADSPLGGGPIVRVGDRLSVFSPALTAAVAKIAQRLAGEARRSAGRAVGDSQRNEDDGSSIAPVDGFVWQRKLLAGGACEATAFCAFGFEATCLCLPLRNYHNMGELEAIESMVKAGQSPPYAPIAPEIISISDFHNLVELLLACGRGLGAVEPIMVRLEKMYAERRFVLDADATDAGGPTPEFIAD